MLCLCREGCSGDESCLQTCTQTCLEYAEDLIADSCPDEFAPCDQKCANEVESYITAGPRPPFFESAEAEAVVNCIEGIEQGSPGFSEYGHPCDEEPWWGCGVDTSYGCADSCCECHTACRTDAYQDDDYSCQEGRERKKLKRLLVPTPCIIRLSSTVWRV